MAGVALGLLTPARPLAPAAVTRDWTLDLSDDPTPAELHTMTALARSTVSLAERVQHALNPVTSYVVVPLFALANAGVALTANAFRSPGATPVAAGIAVGLVVGTLVGITGVAWLAARAGVGRLPDGLRWSHSAGAGAVAGIGFTVSLFIADLAFPDSALGEAAKLGVLGASLAASVLGAAMVWTAARLPRRAGAELPR